jgi:hypothetical protein
MIENFGVVEDARRIFLAKWVVLGGWHHMIVSRGVVYDDTWRVADLSC